jgi:hypothetical protein
MWQPMVAALSTHHRVYAVDTIWDIRRSVYTRPLKGPVEGHDLVLAQTELVHRKVIDFLNQP